MPVFPVLLPFLKALLKLVKIVCEIPAQYKQRTAMNRFAIMATNEYLTRDPPPVAPPDRSILVGATHRSILVGATDRSILVGATDRSLLVGATDRSLLVGATDNSRLVAINPLLVWTAKALVLSASVLLWYAQTINNVVPACNEDK